MGSSALSYRARDGDRFARFRCAGVLRSSRISDERYAASVRHSDRTSECRELVRPQLLRDSTLQLLRAEAFG